MRFPVLNAECFGSCLRPVGRPDGSAEPLSSFLSRGGAARHEAVYPVSCRILLCYCLLQVKEFPFPCVVSIVVG